MGEHGGAAGFTVGQRQGLGVALGEPRYVSRVDPATNVIMLGRREDLETTTIELEDVTFVADAPPGGRDADGAWTPFRAAGPRSGTAATLVARRCGRRRLASRRAAGAWIVETDTPVWAIAPGQACVLYDGDACLGGGRIAAPAPTAGATGRRAASPEPVRA